MHAPRPSLKALTGLRFLAAFHVVLFHLMLISTVAIPVGLARVLRAGPAAVSLFFGLSGFLLTYNYLREEGRVDKRRFWSARLARIYPVHAFALVVAWYFFLHASANAGALLTAPLLVQAWTPATACAWNCPAWSLSAELFFYLLFPFLLPLVARLPARRLPWLLGACWAFAVLPPFWILVVRTPPDDLSTLWDGILGYSPLARLPEFVAGVVLGRLFLERQAQGEAPLPGWVAPAALAALVVGYWAATPAMAPLVRNGLFLPVNGALLYALAGGRGWLAALLATRPAVLLGEASYALYLLHVPLGSWVGYFGFDIVGSASVELAYLALCVGVSLVVFVEVEEPARRWMRAALGGGRAKPRATPPTSAASP